MTETPAPPPPDSAQERRSAAELRVTATADRFRTRTRRVLWFRRVLPIAIAILAGGVIAWIGLRTVISGAERQADTGREIRLDKPMFHGQDAEGRSFVIGAQGAVRDPATGRFKLVGPVLRLNLGGEKITEMTADAGLYDDVARRVVIGPNVRISDGGSGFTLTTPEAVVDTRTGVVTGSKGVQGSGPLGTINASSYAIHEQGERVTFSGSGDNKIRGTINPRSGR